MFFVGSRRYTRHSKSKRKEENVMEKDFKDFETEVPTLTLEPDFGQGRDTERGERACRSCSKERDGGNDSYTGRTKAGG